MSVSTYEEWVAEQWPRPCYVETDFHAVATIQLGELIDCGWFNWKEDEGWVWDYYDQTQKLRLQAKLDNHYFWREIGCLPPLQWKMEFLRKLNEIMPKYKHLYKMLDTDPKFDPLQHSRKKGDIKDAFDEWFKSRNIGSDFPQTMLSGNSDYASTGEDREYEKLHTLDRNQDIVELGDVLDKWIEFQDKFKDVDVMIIEEMGSVFGHLSSVSINAW